MPQNSKSNSKILIFLIHGIRWSKRGDWLQPWTSKLKALNPNLRIFHFRYGRILAVWSFLMTSNIMLWFSKRFLNQHVDGLANKIRKAKKQFPEHDISILAHSYGTFITYKMLERHPDIRLLNFVMAGGVVDHQIAGTELWNWLESGRLSAVFNHCSHNDKVVKYIALEWANFGKCGYWGFIRPGKPSDRGKPPKKPFSVPIFNIQHFDGHDAVTSDPGPDHFAETVYHNLTFRKRASSPSLAPLPKT